MTETTLPRKSLDNREFLRLRQATEKISRVLNQRVRDHMSVLKPLFLPRKLLGAFIKSSSPEEVNGSDQAFARLQEEFGAICGDPFNLPKKLQTPLPAISNQLECTPYQYQLSLADETATAVTITSPTRFILSFQSECPLNRLKAMLTGTDARQPDDMRQALLNHLAMVIFLERFPSLSKLLEDLRYQVEIQKIDSLAGLRAVVLTAPLTTFLPPDDFIQEITQLSGIPAFQELIDLEVLERLPDPLAEALRGAL